MKSIVAAKMRGKKSTTVKIDTNVATKVITDFSLLWVIKLANRTAAIAKHITSSVILLINRLSRSLS